MKTFAEILRQTLLDVAEAKKDPKHCPCGKLLVGDERDGDKCSACEVASWSPEKKKAMGRLIGLGLRRSNGVAVPDEQIDSAIDDAFRHVR